MYKLWCTLSSQIWRLWKRDHHVLKIEKTKAWGTGNTTKKWYIWGTMLSLDQISFKIYAQCMIVISLWSLILQGRNCNESTLQKICCLLKLDVIYCNFCICIQFNGFNVPVNLMKRNNYSHFLLYRFETKHFGNNYYKLHLPHKLNKHQKVLSSFRRLLHMLCIKILLPELVYLWKIQIKYRIWYYVFLFWNYSGTVYIKCNVLLSAYARISTKCHDTLIN